MGRYEIVCDKPFVLQTMVSISVHRCQRPIYHVRVAPGLPDRIRHLAYVIIGKINEFGA